MVGSKSSGVMVLPATPQHFNTAELLIEWLKEQNCSIRNDYGYGRADRTFSMIDADTDDWSVRFYVGSTSRISVAMYDPKYEDGNGALGPYEAEFDLSDPNTFDELKEILAHGCEALGFIRGCVAYWYAGDEDHEACFHDKDICFQNHDGCYGLCRSEIE